MVDLKAEDRSWTAPETEAQRDDLSLDKSVQSSPFYSRPSLDLSLDKSEKSNERVLIQSIGGSVSRVLLPRLIAAALFLFGCSAAPGPAEVSIGRPGVQSIEAPEAPEVSEDCHRAESERFALYSDPWVNLHHFLFEWARNVPERKPEDPGRAVDVIERAQIAELDQGERHPFATKARRSRRPYDLQPRV